MIDMILVWNVRGLGRSRKRLKSLVKKHRATVVTILEPFHEESKMQWLASFLEFSKYCCNESSGGKVWLFWKDDYELEVLHMTDESLLGWFCLGINRVLVTFVYAKCTRLERHSLWGELESICIVESPWLVVGDFNVIRSDSKRIGGTHIHCRQWLSLMKAWIIVNL